MLNISKSIDGNRAVFSLEGRLDTVTAPELKSGLREIYDGITELVFDFGQLEYISSAGLRVLLTAQKVMSNQGSMKIQHVNASIMEIFEITGFSDILTIE